MTRHLLVLTLLVVAARGPADDPAPAAAELAKATANYKRMKDLQARGLGSAMEVLTAEVQMHQAKAAWARAAGDDSEEDARAAAVKTLETILDRVEGLQKQGVLSSEDVDLWRRNLAVGKIELAALRGQQKAIVAQLRVIVGIEDRRLARARKLFENGSLAKGEMAAAQKAADDAKARLRQAGGVD